MSARNLTARSGTPGSTPWFGEDRFPALADILRVGFGTVRVGSEIRRSGNDRTRPVAEVNNIALVRYASLEEVAFPTHAERWEVAVELLSVPHADLSRSLRPKVQALLAMAFPDLEGDYYKGPVPDRLFICCDDSQPVAHLAAYRRTAKADDKDCLIGMIGGVAVSPTHRRKGLSKLLIHEAHQFFRSEGISHTILFAFEPTIYASSGYELMTNPVRFVEAGEERQFVYRGSMIAHLDGSVWSVGLLDLQGEVV
ncbi:GNAT family N-acetyltransferase [Phenylobacterium ferrooxidans]|uniref:GNAT family N-acetyltransferase n=1 Tax=Phenylobacterium ferrooxidans TaxID=2982689 RepID=A0ABW6CU81_9CAUL